MRKWLAVLLALSFAGVARADIIQTDPSLESGATPISGGTEERLCRKKNGFISCDSLLSDDGNDVTLTSGQMLVPNGSLSAPSYSFTNDSNSGFSTNGAGTLRVSISGTSEYVFDASRLRPHADNVNELGASTIRWTNGFFSTQLGIHDGNNFTTSLTTRGLNARPQSETCADSGDGNNATLTLTPSSTYIEITNNDADGCDVTMGEGSAVAGDIIQIAVISNAGGTVNFSDTAALSETAGVFNAAVNDTISMVYGNAGDAASATFREVARSNN